MKNVEQVRRETARWIALTALYHGMGCPTSERLIHSVLEAVPLPATLVETRALLHFLQQAGLATVTRRPDGATVACITKEGTDVVEYNAVCPAGIARPEQYW